MSRIIVKNLPKNITEQKLREHFAIKGFITDVNLKYTHKGVFRQFAFIGYKSDIEAQDAVDYFHNTYINSSKLKVEKSLVFGDAELQTPWIKEKAYKKALKRNEIIYENPEKNSKLYKRNSTQDEKTEKKSEEDKVVENSSSDLVVDLQFKEFLELHKRKRSRPTWCDTGIFLDEENSNSDNDSVDNVDEKNIISKKKKLPEVKDNLKSEHVMKKSSQVLEAPDAPPEKKLKTDIKPENAKEKSGKTQYTERPKRNNNREMKQFLLPLKPRKLLTPSVFSGFAVACFKNEDEVSQAISKSGQHILSRKVFIKRDRSYFASSDEPYDTSFENEKREVIFEHEEEIQRKEELLKESEEEKKRKQELLKESEEEKQRDQELLGETGRLFIKKFADSVTQTDVEELFSKYGPLAEVNLPLDRFTKTVIGYGFVAYVFPEHAANAYSELNGAIFQGQFLKITPAKPKKNAEPEDLGTNFKKKREAQLKALSGSSHNWNILFLGMNAVADITSERYNIDKSKLLSSDSKESVAVRMALAETQAVVDTRKFLVDQGVVLDSFSQPAAERSKTVIIVKNLPAKSSSKDILEMFSRYGSVNRVILPPSGLVAMVVFQEPTDAKLAFQKLAYARFQHLPLYLEWAPVNVIDPNVKPMKLEDEEPPKDKIIVEKEDNASQEAETSEEEDEEPEPDTTVFVKNINFNTTLEKFREHFKKCGPIHSATISMKKDLRTGKLLSMGFGFVQFKERTSAVNAIQHMQLSMLDGYALQVKFSSRSIVSTASPSGRKKAHVKKQQTSKILVRNIPFEASEGEVRDLFKMFGTLKLVRLPKKLGDGGHRGFGFVEYLTKSQAKRAFETLCHSTHLFGRRLVLEWANPETEDVTELRKKTAHNFYTNTSGSKLTKKQLNDEMILASSRRKYYE